MMRTLQIKEENRRVVPFQCEFGEGGEEGTSVKLGGEINMEERDDGKARLRKTVTNITW